MFKKLFLICIGMSFILASSCSTMKKSLLTGVTVGGVTGLATGVAVAKQKKHAVTSALIGAAVGTLTSYFIHKGLEKRDAMVRRDTLLKLDQFDISTPYNLPVSAHGITMPVVESQWVDTKVQGKKLIEGHRIWLISDDPKWIPNVVKDKQK